MIARVTEDDVTSSKDAAKNQACPDCGKVRAPAESKRAELEVILAEYGVTALFLDGFDSAIIGIAFPSFGGDARVVYSAGAIVQSLVEEGLPHDKAYDYYVMAFECADLGPSTPVFVWVGGS